MRFALNTTGLQSVFLLEIRAEILLLGEHKQMNEGDDIKTAGKAILGVVLLLCVILFYLLGR